MLHQLLHVLTSLLVTALTQRESLRHLHRKVDLLMTESNATQADIDALAAQVTTDDQAIAAAVLALQAQISALQGQGVDVSGLQAAVASLTEHANADSAATTVPAAGGEEQPPA